MKPTRTSRCRSHSGQLTSSLVIRSISLLTSIFSVHRLRSVRPMHKEVNGRCFTGVFAFNLKMISHKYWFTGGRDVHSPITPGILHLLSDTLTIQSPGAPQESQVAVADRQRPIMPDKVDGLFHDRREVRALFAPNHSFSSARILRVHWAADGRWQCL
jgi:hypothetical protein